MSLEDIDSVNFDLGVHDFNPFAHQPHPPGFPVFTVLAKMVHPLFDNHAAGLAAVSAICSAIVLPLFYFVAQRMIGRPGAFLAGVILVFNPLFWLNSVRPMSDVAGFAWVLAAQSLLLYGWSSHPAHSRTDGFWIAGAITAGLAIGVRIQNAALLMPILALGVLSRPRLFVPTAACIATSCALWIVPTITESGGPTRFVAQLQLILSVAWPSEPLASALSWERARQSALDVLVLPWAEMWIACGAVIAAAVGLLLMWRDPQIRQQLIVLIVLFGPYTAYHFLFQQTATLRYAIPALPLIVIPAAYAVSRAVRNRVSVMVAVAGVVVAVCATVTIPKLDAYSSNPSPPVQAIQRLVELALKERVVVSGDHVFERYVPYLASVAPVIQPKPREEWRALNRYWVAGNRHPVMYLTDTARTVLKLADPQAQTRIDVWEWPEPLSTLQRGMRPAHVELVRVDPPRWFAESGFLLTPDAGPPNRVSKEKHLLFVRRDLESDRLMVSGATAGPTVVSVVVGHTARQDWTVSENFSVQAIVPPRSTAPDYTPVQFESAAPLWLSEVSLLGSRDDVVRPTNGFYGTERDEENKEFRWIAPKAEVLVSRSGSPIWLTLRGYVHIQHVRLPLTVEAWDAGRLAGRYEIKNSAFTITVHLPATSDRSSLVSLSTSQWFVPAEVEGNGDNRRLALQVYTLDVDTRPPRD